jgi:hypothetical protein
MDMSTLIPSPLGGEGWGEGGYFGEVTVISPKDATPSLTLRHQGGGDSGMSRYFTDVTIC